MVALQRAGFAPLFFRSRDCFWAHLYLVGWRREGGAPCSKGGRFFRVWKLEMRQAEVARRSARAVDCD